jgi:hypothetical protein
MADKKISALTAATTPLVGSEVLPIVQSGSTVKVSVNNLTAGKTVPASALNITAPTYGNSGSISNPNDPNDQVLFTITNGANTDGGIARGGGTVLSLRDRTSNSGSGTIGYGLYVTAPYDGTNASGNTYALTKYGIFVDDIYNFYGLNATLGSTNYGLYVKGGGRNYLKADTQFDNNIVIGTAAKGIDFSANTASAGMTSELLNWYEEGTWTATVTAESGTITTYTTEASYTRVGKIVSVRLAIRLANVGSASGALIFTGLPFATRNYTDNYPASTFLVRETWVSGDAYQGFIADNSSTGYIVSMAGDAINWSNDAVYVFEATYMCA